MTRARHKHTNTRSRVAGEWKDDKRNGSGTYYWLDGRKYEGKWRNGDYHGWGVYSWPDGRRYEVPVVRCVV